jgi:hypothetical protein
MTAMIYTSSQRAQEIAERTLQAASRAAGLSGKHRRKVAEQRTFVRCAGGAARIFFQRIPWAFFSAPWRVRCHSRGCWSSWFRGLTDEKDYL